MRTVGVRERIAAGLTGPRPPTRLASRTMVPDDQTERQEGFAEVGDVRLHYVEAGEGPLIVLLHGFPEFWFGWLER